MSWFTRHINWTYILFLILSLLLLFAFNVASSSSEANEDNLYGLRIYLDSTYTREWVGSNLPDFNNLTWGPDDKNGENWESATLMVYLDNTGPYDLKVDTAGYSDLSHVTAGWGVSSDTLNIKSGERNPLALELSHNQWIDVYSPMIYYNAVPLETGSSWTPTLIWCAALILAAGWLLYQKKRSYAWFLLSLSGIGIIILLCLENKRCIPEVTTETEVDDEKAGDDKTVQL